jgi:cell division protein FtsL
MKKKFSFAAVFFIAGIILAAGISISAVKEAYRSRTIEKEVNSLKQEAERIQNDNNALQKQIDYYSTSQFVERVSKDKMNMQKPDENVVVVNQGITKQPQVPGEQSEVSKADNNESNYKKWWNFFFKYNP